jgi:hypothetical protein
LRKEDISIGYEIWARPGLGNDECQSRAAKGTAPPEGFRPFLQHLWNPVNEYSLVGDVKGFCVYKLAMSALNLPGDFVEFGSYRGGLSFMLGLLARQVGSKKITYMHDNFDKGLPKPDRNFDKTYAEGTMSCPLHVIQESIEKLQLSSHCIPKPGLFTDTIDDYPDDQKFSLAHIDCDLYHGARECLEFLWPRLPAGAPVILDDYYDESHGVMIAMNEFAEEHGIVIHLSMPCQAYWIKGERPDETDASQLEIDGHNVWLTADAARETPGLIKWMELLLENQADRVTRLENFIAICRGD